MIAVEGNKLVATLEMGDVRIVREPRKQIVVQQLNGGTKWKPVLVLDEIEAADFNSKLDDLLKADEPARGR